VVSPGDIDAWDDGVEDNYWSNYTGVDLNHDGIEIVGMRFMKTTSIITL